MGAESDRPLRPIKTCAGDRPYSGLVPQTLAANFFFPRRGTLVAVSYPIRGAVTAMAPGHHAIRPQRSGREGSWHFTPSSRGAIEGTGRGADFASWPRLELATGGNGSCRC